MERAPKEKNHQDSENSRSSVQGQFAPKSSQGGIAARIDNSPHMVAQHQKLTSLFGDAAQLQNITKKQSLQKSSNIAQLCKYCGFEGKNNHKPWCTPEYRAKKALEKSQPPKEKTMEEKALEIQSRMIKTHHPKTGTKGTPKDRREKWDEQGLQEIMDRLNKQKTSEEEKKDKK